MSRRRKKISGSLLQPLLDLYRKQAWLEEREEQLLDLIDLCVHKGQQDLLFDLLCRFRFLTAREYSSLTREMLETVLSQWDLRENTTQFVATTFDNEADSAQAFLCAIKHNLVCCPGNLLI